MTGSLWLVKDGVLGLESDLGHFLTPSAIEIFRVQFQGAEQAMGERCRKPQVDLPHLHLSKYPAEPALRILREGNRVRGIFGVIANAEFSTLSEDIDQVIIDETWYPIDLASLVEGRQSAYEFGAISCEVSLGTLVKLRLAKQLPFRLIDEVAANEDRNAREAAGRPLEREGVNAVLYPYQADGIDFLNLIADQNIGCVLADEMGLGKTLQVIGMLVHLSSTQSYPVLIVAPASLLENWRREISQFAPTLSTRVHAGDKRAGTASALGSIDILITSYETVVRDAPLLSSYDWHAVVLDEAQAIKNPDAQRTRAVKDLNRKVSIAVSGTPLENRLDDLWSVSDFCLPGILGDLDHFRNSYSDEVTDAKRLGDAVAPLILRRRVADVASDLPEKIEIKQPINLTDGEARDYVAIRERVISEHGPAGALVATTVLRTFCADPALTKYPHQHSSSPGSKFVRVVELLEEIFANEEKALIFSSFHGVADLLSRELPRLYPHAHFDTIDGRTPVGSRQYIVDAFFQHQGVGALMLNPKAAGSGLNITAANHVIHYNPEWNPALTAQASARSFRRKQTRPVTIHHLFHPGTVEEVIIERSQFKRALADGAVTGHDGSPSSSDLANALAISPIDQHRQ
ncbi:DEAD/DEAH box helicase [Stenotrophomonas maltophilia]|uniref:DEAD/DEAH box helicase n=1 Tax=Stenotrophomonas maltophilia TaxID=40324 RepID=UPI0034DB00F0